MKLKDMIMTPEMEVQMRNGFLEPTNADEEVVDVDHSDEEDDGGRDHFLTNIEKDTVKNQDFRRVEFTATNMQVVLMSIPPGGEIGTETHEAVDQFIRVESGNGRFVFNGEEENIKDGSAFVIPQGTEHNVVNTSKGKDLKLYSIYSPPHHGKDVVHRTREEAEADDEAFNGDTDV